MIGTDSRQAVEFLTALFEPGDFTAFRPIEVYEENGKRRSRVDYPAIAYGLHGRKNGDGGWHESTAAIEAAVSRQLARAATERTNLFFGVAPRFGGQGHYDQAWQIRVVRVLYVDVDDTDDPAELHKRCKAAGLPEPSIIVHSGNGLHAYWLLTEPYLIDDADDPPAVHVEWTEARDGKRKARRYIKGESGEKLYLDIPANRPALSEKAQHATDVLQGLAKGIGGDATHDLSRLLRLPGSKNAKNARNGAEPKPCRIIESHPERRYPFADFERFADQAPDRQRREKVARVKPPSAKKPKRSRRAKHRGDKPADAEELPVANVEISEDEEGNEIADPLPMREVTARIFDASDNWPRRVDDALFVDVPPRGVTWLDSPAALFGWIQDRHGVIAWRRSGGCVTQAETFAEVARNATAYDEVASLPHEPAIEGVYYSGSTPEPGDGSALAAFLDFFAPATPIDRELLTAVVATPLWGGPPGARPAAMFTATTGRGRGKSKLAQFISRIYGGTIDIDPNGDIGTIKTRLLSPGAVDRRIALLDNVKSTRFSWGEMEALITADAISGKRLYIGEATRPNYLTWLITLNGASLSTDMAQRVVEIRLADPNYSDDWEERVSGFIRDRQQQIIGDLIAFLRQPAKSMRRHSRWAAWESGVLSRVPHPDDCIDAILERRAETDVEEEEGRLIEEHFGSKLRWLGYDPQTADVFLPNPIVVRWYGEATGDKAKRTTGVTRALVQMRNEGRLHCIVQGRASGSSRERGFRWIGEFCDEDSTTDFSITKRLAEERQQNDSETQGKF